MSQYQGNWTKRLSEAVDLLSDGHEGARRVLREIEETGTPGGALDVYLSLQEYGLKGAALWDFYKDECGENADVFATKAFFINERKNEPTA